MIPAVPSVVRNDEMDTSFMLDGASCLVELEAEEIISQSSIGVRVAQC